MALLKIQEPQQEKISPDQPKDIILGIDLGTTNSLVGVVIDNAVHLFSDEFGNNLHKSVVSFDSQGNLVAVGNQANSEYNAIKISSIKRLMGKNLRDIKNSEFKFDESDPSHDNISLLIGEKKYSPEKISAEILKYLKNLAEKKLIKTAQNNEETEKQKIEKAVITVPAYFDEAAKNATKLAAKLAGLEVLRLVNEPTAAALAYGLDNKSEGIYGVYDLGGGTFDISVLKMQQGVFKVLGVAGDTELGGDDFDEILARKIQEKIAVDFFEAKNIAKKIKEELSYKNTVESSVSSINGNVKFLFSRQEFEQLIIEKINKTIFLTTKLIEDLNLETLDIKGLIMVGGSSKIPLIHQKLSEIFGADKVLTNLDPDRVVAMGAAWQAFNLSGANQNLLLDVAPLSLGIEMMGGIVDKVIMRNSSIPAIAKKEFTTYADNQTGMQLHIVQGEREFAKDCRSLARFEIKNIPAMKAGMARIIISFKVDADGLLTVLAEEKITGEKQEIIVKPSYGLDENEIKKMLLDSMKNAADDMQNRLLTQTINESKQTVKILQDDLQTYKNLISQDETKNILQKLNILKELLAAPQDRDKIIAAEKNLEKAAENLVLQKVNQSLKTLTGNKI